MMMIPEIGAGFQDGEVRGIELAAVLLGLLLFGIGYNWFVTRLEQEGHDRGYTSLLVVAGVMATLAGALVIVGWQAVMVVALCFIASGLPMIWGSIVRHVRERAAEARLARELIEERLNGDGS